MYINTIFTFVNIYNIHFIDSTQLKARCSKSIILFTLNIYTKCISIQYLHL